MDDVIWFGKPTVLSFASLFVGTILGVISIVVVWRFLGAPFLWVPTVGLAIAVLMVDFSFKRAGSIAYRISDYGVSKDCRYLILDVDEIPFDKIAEVVVSRGALGRILRFGTVKVNSASVSFHNVELKGVRKPEEVRRIILAAKKRALAN